MAGNPDGVSELWEPGSERKRIALAGGLSLLLHGLLLLLPATVLDVDGLAFRPASKLVVSQLSVSIVPPVAPGDGKAVVSPTRPMTSGALMVAGTYQLADAIRDGAPERRAGQEVALLKIPDLEYRTASKLTQRPQPLGTIALETQEIRFRKETGSLIVAVRINWRGMVDSVDVEHSDLPPFYAQTARSAFAKTRFRPGEVEGRPVNALMRIKITYVPLLVPVAKDVDSDPEHRTLGH